MLIIAAAASFVLYIAYCLIKLDRDLNPPGIPRFGAPGFTGFIATAVRFALDAEACIDEGWAQFSGHPFMIPTLVRLVLLLNFLTNTAPNTHRQGQS